MTKGQNKRICETLAQQIWSSKGTVYTATSDKKKQHNLKSTVSKPLQNTVYNHNIFILRGPQADLELLQHLLAVW